MGIAAVILAVALVTIAGLLAGVMAWPIRLLRTYGFEHWTFIGWLVGLILLPWLALFAAFPGSATAMAEVPWREVAIANGCSVAWGIANVLACLCLGRIGFGLTAGLLTGIGLPIGILAPMVIPGSGDFARAPGLDSPAGQAILVGTSVLVLATIITAWAGFLREGAGARSGQPRGSVLAGMAMAAAAGVLQAGLSFAFVYSQGPVTAVFLAKGASPMVADLAVWTLALPGGALVNVGCSVWLLTRNRSWRRLGSGREAALSAVVGINFVAFLLIYGFGCRMLGPAGAALGFGIYQAMMIVSAQGLGIICGEWRGSPLRSRWLMALGVGLLLVGVAVISAATLR